ncbi:kinetochore protein Spc24 [Strigops habroptila]|uniref:Kinetochore protein Spc24 n=1 Tax=Strigops habroptila TaxID=2489341 RepID=A0A672UZT7_STRHB|nr:kinetochore protein Spc24 [Strigops habroptila]
MAGRPLQELEELEELSEELGKLLLSGRAAALLRQGLELQARGDNGLLAAQAEATRLDTELRAAEETVARALVAREAAVQRGRQRLRELRDELRRAREALGSLRDSNGALRRELEELKVQQQQLEEDNKKDEDGVISLEYIIHLYHKLSHISWDHEAEPWHIKGVHFGPPIAQPIDIDGRRHSRCFISDYLWSLIPSEW